LRASITALRRYGVKLPQQPLPRQRHDLVDIGLQQLAESGIGDYDGLFEQVES
jgi:hypothetical protein